MTKLNKPDYKALERQIFEAMKNLPGDPVDGKMDTEAIMDATVEMVNFLENQHIKAIACALGIVKLGVKPERRTQAMREFLDGCVRDFQIGLRHAIDRMVQEGIIEDPYKSTHNDQVREAILRELAEGKIEP